MLPYLGRLYLACALLLRGKVHLSDVRRNIEKLRSQLSFVSWNQEGWKTGLCAQAAHGQPYSLLALTNNTCIRESFAGMKERFGLLYKRKAHIHHYTQVDGMSKEQFDEALGSLNDLMSEYRDLERRHDNQIAADSSSKRSDFTQRVQVLS